MVVLKLRWLFQIPVTFHRTHWKFGGQLVASWYLPHHPSANIDGPWPLERCIGEIWTLLCFVPSIPNELMHGSRRIQHPETPCFSGELHDFQVATPCWDGSWYILFISCGSRDVAGWKSRQPGKCQQHVASCNVLVLFFFTAEVLNSSKTCRLLRCVVFDPMSPSVSKC